MVNIVGSTDDFNRWKPKTMRNHLTVTELARSVNRTTGRIKKLERDGRLPSPVRVQVGELSIRLYSPKDVAKVKAFFEHPDRDKFKPKLQRRRRAKIRQ